MSLYLASVAGVASLCASISAYRKVGLVQISNSEGGLILYVVQDGSGFERKGSGGPSTSNGSLPGKLYHVGGVISIPSLPHVMTAGTLISSK